MGKVVATLPLIGQITAGGLLTTGLSVFGGIAQQRSIAADTRAQEAQLRAQESAARFNQTIALQNREIVKGQTKAELDKADRERRLRLGSAIASAGASGVGTASFGDVILSSAAQEELDVLTIQSEGLLRERQFQNESLLEGSRAQNAASQIPLVKSAGKARSGAALLSGLSSAVSRI